MGDLRWYRLRGGASPLLKQLPSTVAILAAVLLTFAVPDLEFTNPTFATIGVALIVLATVHAAVWSGRDRRESFAVLVIPMVDIIGFGLFRFGTGAGQSLFSTLVLLPIVWLATARGWKYLLTGVLLTSATILVPYFAAPPERLADWFRDIITPLVFAAAAAVIKQLSRQQRTRIEEAEQLVAERTHALEANETMIVQLREGEQRYRTLSESFENLWQSITAQAVIATDMSGKIEAWTPGAQKLFGLTAAEALADVRVDRFFEPHVLNTLGVSLAEDVDPGANGEQTAMSHGISLTSPATTPITLPIIDSNAVLHTASSAPLGLDALFALADLDQDLGSDLEVRTDDGKTVPARVTVSHRSSAQGGQLGYLIVITDETRAAEVSRMRDQFVGMISHELRTPLSSIIGFLDLLSSDPAHPLSDEQGEFVSIIERNAQRLLSLVGDLLFTAQVESGHFPLNRSDIDVAECVRTAVASARVLAQEKQVGLGIDLPDEPLLMPADAGRIGQALDNLVSNALKFTPAGGSVTVGARRVSDTVELWVRDTGMGIPKDEQSQLSTRFFRASTATRNAVPGVGLGLSITKAIVIAHCGELHVTSEEGVGTEFRLVLPSLSE